MYEEESRRSRRTTVEVEMWVTCLVHRSVKCVGCVSLHHSVIFHYSTDLMIS